MRCFLIFSVVELIALLTPLAAEIRLVAPGGFSTERPRMQVGDDPRWARPDFDDRSWTEVAISEGPPLLPTRAGPYWIRLRLEPMPGIMGKPRDAIALSVVAAYDLYWDGRLIARNGIVGRDRESEVPGILDNIVEIPEALRGPGVHVLALRMSSYRSGFPSNSFALTFALGDYRTILTQRALKPVFSLLAAGGALVIGVVFGLMWVLTDRRPATLLFSVLCLTAALMQALQAWRWLLDYPFDWHYPRLLVISSLVVVLGMLMTAHVQTFFQVPFWRTRLLALGVAMAIGWQASHLYHIKSVAVAIVAFGFTASAAVWAVWNGRRSAWVVAAGLGISAMVVWRNPRDFLEHAFFLSFGAPLLGGVTAHVLQWRDERRQARGALLTSARLEVELLKKNIQPHFLLNSLASLLEVIEQSPSGAASLIEALAGEFRILARVSGEKLIPLGQELELCDCHLRVMSMRQGASWRLERNAVNPEILVPPALFHTLIENGITHSEGRARDRVFHLRGEIGGGVTRFTLIAPTVVDQGASGPPVVPNGRPHPMANNSPADGTGMRYVKARLEESFPGRWSLRSGLTPEGWQTAIEIRQRN